ncbi:MAG: L-ascorbate metabolism protein UlaG (beta-lactamase superfamily) [Candidatus Azotimanducaceae bacterium]|jgi:L-ascorbate metabolism protein UlaG (beta-lactamase superfamily)
MMKGKGTVPGSMVVLCLMLVTSSFYVSAASGTKLDAPRDQRVVYLGNEALLIQVGAAKILFDPFFHNDYGIYQLVPDQMRADIFAGKAPFNDITAIFVSHAHGDHFTADDMMKYLRNWQNVHLIAPAQAVRALKAEIGFDEIASRVIGVNLALGDPVWRRMLGNLDIEAIRIPHSGWPERASVENVVFRVKIDGKVSVTHLGDADANMRHYQAYRDHWSKQPTDVAFPPYWFKVNPAGYEILHEHMNVKRAIGIHVPKVVPPKLRQSGEEFFSKPGEEIEL